MKLKPWLPAELHQLGYETPRDMVHLSVAEILRIPGMGGRDWHKIADVQGRERYPVREGRRRKSRNAEE